MMTARDIWRQHMKLEVPACMLWPIPGPYILALPEVDRDYENCLPRVEAWQDNRCGICNRQDPHRRLDSDHDHVTGLYRGYLCRGCNLQEGSAWWRPFKLWRSGWNPATLLGVHVEKLTRYGHPDINHEGRYLRLTPEQRAAYDAREAAEWAESMDKLGAILRGDAA